MDSSKHTIVLLLLLSLIFCTIAGHDLANKTAIHTNKHGHDKLCFPSFIFHCLPSSPSIVPPLLDFLDQRLALVYQIIQNFKDTIISDPLGITSTWVGSDICSYKGFYCDHPPYNSTATAVAAIDFNGYQLTAPTLDGFLDKLPDIALFHANSNNFGGTISPTIAKLQYLYELDLSNNQFTGPFPMVLLAMEGLTFLDLRFNSFSGSVPAAIYNHNLNVLFLNDNDFISSLPYNLNQTHILYLTLANNKFTGPIPRDFSTALSELTEVLLLNNQLAGCLPYELGFLKQVSVLDISNNLLTGPLPSSFSCLERVEVLNLAGNSLYGAVPDLICGLPNLANLSLSNNYFTRVGPLCKNLISRGVLDVQNNCIPGQTSQRSLLYCTKFFSLPRICPHMETYKIIPWATFAKSPQRRLAMKAAPLVYALIVISVMLPLMENVLVVLFFEELPINTSRTE